MSVEVADLKEVCWLDIRARFDTRKLTPGTLYKVAFVIKKSEIVNNWSKKVHLKLNCPDGTTQERKKSFVKIQKKMNGSRFKLANIKFHLNRPRNWKS